MTKRINGPRSQPGRASFVSPDEVAVQGGGAPRSGVLPSARFVRPRLPRQAYQDAQGYAGQSQGTGSAVTDRPAPGQGTGVAVLDLPVPPTKMPRHAKRSANTGSPLDYGLANASQLRPPAEAWDVRSTTWNGPVATMRFANWTLMGGIVSDHGVVSGWARGPAT